MSPAASPPQLPSDLESEVNTFVDDIRHGRLAGSLHISISTVKLVKRLIGQAPWQNANELMLLLKDKLGRNFHDDPGVVTVGNLVRRVLKLIREEHAAAANKGVEGEGEGEQETAELQRMMQSQAGGSAGGQSSGSSAEEGQDYNKVVPGLKATVLESVDELMSELEAAAEEISNQALEHIHANEVILTVGRSRTVELFLKQAAKDRKFQVIVAECGPPGYRGQEMAMSLAKSGIQTTVITDSAIFAMMSRVNKVIVGTAAILADGGLKAVSGTYTAALSAKHYSVPLYVCSAITKLTPRYCTSNDLGAFNRHVNLITFFLKLY